MKRNVIYAWVLALCTIFVSPVSANPWDVIFIQNHTPVFSNITFFNRQITTLKPWYMVLKAKEYEHANMLLVVLTDGKTWFISKGSVYQQNPNFVIPANSGFVDNNTTLRSQPSENSRIVGNISRDDSFFILDVYPHNWQWIQVRMISWNMQNRVWFIHYSDVVLRCIENDYFNIFKRYFNISEGFFEFFNNHCSPDEWFISYTPSSVPIFLGRWSQQWQIITPTKTPQTTWTSGSNDFDFLNDLDGLFWSFDSTPTTTPQPSWTSGSDDFDFFGDLDSLFWSFDNDPITTPQASWASGNDDFDFFGDLDGLLW